jgi:hypothetical protein
MKRISPPMVALVVAALALVASVASPASTQSNGAAVLQRFAGTYRSRLPDGGGALIRAAIESVVVDMAPARESIARRRLLASDPPIPSVTITPRGEGLVIDYTGGRRNETQQLGTFASNPTADGGTVDVKHDVIGSRIRETYRERRGGAVHLFSLSGDGRELTLEATIRSPHLPAPISYSLVFERTR